MQSLLIILTSSVPSIVESLRGSGFATSVELAWTPPTEPNGVITGYFLTYSTGAGSLNSQQVSTTNYTVTGLEENTLYHFTVFAETSAGRGEGSTVSVRTLPDGGFDV